MPGIILDGDPRTPYALQTLARHQMIERLLQDILMDLRICEVEGRDKREYINMIAEAIESIKP